jgi:5'-methylthioadenosine phosphorylase
MYFAM